MVAASIELLSFMLVITSSSWALAAALTLLEGSALSSTAAMKGFKIGAMHFEGTIEGLPGVQITANGSVEDILAQVKAQHPNFKPAFHDVAISARDDGLDLKPRHKTNLICWNINRVYNPALEIAMAAVRSFGGRCGVDPYTCARVGCRLNAGISICNHNDHYIDTDCAYLTSYAQDIHDRCNAGNLSAGQEFDSDGYNILVAHDTCG